MKFFAFWVDGLLLLTFVWTVFGYPSSLLLVQETENEAVEYFLIRNGSYLSSKLWPRSMEENHPDGEQVVRFFLREELVQCLRTLPPEVRSLEVLYTLRPSSRSKQNVDLFWLWVSGDLKTGRLIERFGFPPSRFLGLRPWDAVADRLPPRMKGAVVYHLYHLLPCTPLSWKDDGGAAPMECSV